MKKVLHYVTFEFEQLARFYLVRFDGRGSVLVSRFTDGSYDTFKVYKILDKSVKPNATHAARILDYATGQGDMPIQRTVQGDKPCLQLVRK